MDRLKTFRKYILWLLGFMIFSYLFTYIGLNVSYRNLETPNYIPDGIEIVMAQSTKVNGRIYGKVTSTDINDLNDKYIKISIYNRRNNLVSIKYLKLENLNQDESKKFAVYFSAENIKKYDIEIVDNNEERADYPDVFTDEEMKTAVIFGVVLGIINVI